MDYNFKKSLTPPQTQVRKSKYDDLYRAINEFEYNTWYSMTLPCEIAKKTRTALVKYGHTTGHIKLSTRTTPSRTKPDNVIFYLKKQRRTEK